MRLTPTLVCALLVTSGPAWAGTSLVFADRPYSVPVKTMKERLFDTTVAQQHDFSCGAAAVATLLTYHYEHPVSEADVFKAMYEGGERQTIRKRGFSMLDMKRYLEANGFKAEGYRLSLAQLETVAVPVIVLVKDNGYNHFVVVKGIKDDRILLGDPAMGMRTVTRADFERAYGGVSLLIRNYAARGKLHFNLRADWAVRPSGPMAMAIARDNTANTLMLLSNGGGDF